MNLLWYNIELLASAALLLLVLAVIIVLGIIIVVIIVTGVNAIKKAARGELGKEVEEDEPHAFD